ncbi:hypothetical protein GH153_03030 [bacterium]|nr:hypothetical protein [bacterium]
MPLSLYEAINKPEKGSRFDELSSEDQEIVEKMKKNSWLLDNKKEKKDDDFERTVIVGDDGEEISVKEFLNSEEYLKRKK